MPRLADFIASHPAGSQLIFVDDGSTDSTAEQVEKYLANHPDHSIQLLRRPHAGKGAAVSAGLAAAGADYLGFCDIDLATPLDQLDRVYHAAVRGQVLAVGSRDLAGSHLIQREPRFRETLGRLYNRLVQLTLTPGIVDTQCGAKVATRAIWHSILPNCRESGFAWDVESIALAKSLGIPVQEVAIEWSHDDRSRVRLLRDGLSMVLAIARIRRNVTNVRRAAAASAAGAVFDTARASRLATVDDRHWWFLSKASFVSWALRRWARPKRDQWLIDVGAGAGGVTRLLGWNTDRLLAIEGATILARQAREVHGLLAVVGSVNQLPMADGAASVVCLLDVVEHIENPRRTLEEAHRILGPTGRLIVTVPAHRWLWSQADENLGHFRRYTRRGLREDLALAGFKPLFVSHVFSWLLLPVWLTRRLSRNPQRQTGLDLASPGLAGLALAATRIERAILRLTALPVGTSILCVAEKAPRGDAGANSH